MITNSQINNIHDLPVSDKVTIATEIFESLGVVSVEEYAKIINISKRSVYRGMKEGRIKYIPVSKIKLPYINK